MGDDRCNVVAEGCLAPPALANGRIRTRCFKCGLTVCRSCSAVQPYLRYGRKRICQHCAEELRAEQALQGHRCGTVAFPLGGEVGTCVDCGKRWVRSDRREAIRAAEQGRGRR